MKFERGEPSVLGPLVDEDGRHYGVQPNGYINFNSVSWNLMSKQSQYGSRYIDGAIQGYPKLGEGLRINGDPGNYHSVSIHPDDIDEFMLRYSAYNAYRYGFVVDNDGTVYETDEAIEATLRSYLDSIGAFDTQWARGVFSKT